MVSEKVRTVAESLLDAYGRALVDIARVDPKVTVVDPDPAGSASTAAFREQFPDRLRPVGATEGGAISLAAGLALEGRSVFAGPSSVLALGEWYDAIRRSVCRPRANVTIVAAHGGLPAGGAGSAPELLEDLGLMRGLPGMTVVCPADAPTTEAAVRALHAREGPAYLRLTRERLPRVGDGAFEIGRAAERRAGSELTIVAVGALVAMALDVAEEFHRVGVEVRVLDFASVKPFDEKALLKAARETGAILTMEEHTVLTGVGALVASTTSEEYPVPVRRIGLPDLFGEAVEPSALRERFGMSRERCLEEGYELLRLRGKVQ